MVTLSFKNLSNPIMTNNKSKSTPRSRLQKLKDEMLFMKQFHHIDDYQPDDIRDQLEGLAYQPGKLTSIFSPRRREVQIEVYSDHHYTYEIKTKLGRLYTELTARGHIYRDEATQQTSFTGKIKFDPIFLTVLVVGWFFLITWAMTGLSLTGSLPSPFILFTLGLTNLFYFRQMFIDRNELLKSLEEMVMTSDMDVSHQRLALAESQSETFDTDADDLNQQYHQASS